MAGWTRLASVPSGATPGRPPRRTHLRVGAGELAGPACGNDLRAAARGHGRRSIPLTDDPAAVTCRVCRRSYAFQVLPGEPG